MKTSSAATDYAKVFYEVCEERNIVVEVLYEIRGLLKVDLEIRQLFGIPVITKAMKKELLDEISKANIRPEIINLLKILVDNNELNIFKEILHEYQNIYQVKNEIKIVNLTVARPLSSANLDAIREKLEEQLNSFIVLTTEIDEDVIGGTKISYDGKEIDNTINKQLKELKKQFT